MKPSLPDIALFILGGVLFPALLRAIQTMIANRIVKTGEDAIKWAHYRNHAAKQGHAPKHPLHCEDDGCKQITS